MFLAAKISHMLNYMTGKLVLQAAVVTVVIFLSLTLYTFWAAKKGDDFNFLGPFLFTAMVTLLVFSLIQVKTNLVSEFSFNYK
jgi:protein lifeguard